MRSLTIITAMIFVLAACQSNKSTDKENKDNSFDQLMSQMHPEKDIHVVVVKDFEDAGNYTYVKLDEGGREYWAAVNAMPVEKGNTYYYTEGMMMKDFESKQLGKTFDSVMFIQEFSAKPMTQQKMPQQGGAHEHTKSMKNTSISIDAAEGGINIEELYRSTANYDGEKVKVRGQVVKINNNIMKRNWIHIQDGSGYDGNYDLTVTTTLPVSFKVGDIITFEGIIATDKDFGAGYFYEVIMEDATTLKEKI